MRFALIIFLSFILSGCATSPVYNPMQVDSKQEIVLNESSFKAIQVGMSLDQVHKIMGQEFIIGYAGQTSGYKSLSIPNPYKEETVKDTGFLIEYYVESIRQPDGVVSDNELMPLVFKNGKLIGRGWPLANSVRPAHPLL